MVIAHINSYKKRPLSQIYSIILFSISTFIEDKKLFYDDNLVENNSKYTFSLRHDSNISKIIGFVFPIIW